MRWIFDLFWIGRMPLDGSADELHRWQMRSVIRAMSVWPLLFLGVLLVSCFSMCSAEKRAQERIRIEVAMEVERVLLSEKGGRR